MEFALALFLIGKLLLDPLPCSRPEMPAKIIPAALRNPRLNSILVAAAGPAMNYHSSVSSRSAATIVATA